MPARASKAQQSPSSLRDVQFKALPAPGSSPRSQALARSETVHRVRSEFREMRGLSPTVDQASRLFQINREECVQILQCLVEEGFLTRTTDGRYRLPSQR